MRLFINPKTGKPVYMKADPNSEYPHHIYGLLHPTLTIRGQIIDKLRLAPHLRSRMLSDSARVANAYAWIPWAARTYRRWMDLDGEALRQKVWAEAHTACLNDTPENRIAALERRLNLMERPDAGLMFDIDRCLRARARIRAARNRHILRRADDATPEARRAAETGAERIAVLRIFLPSGRIRRTAHVVRG